MSKSELFVGLDLRLHSDCIQHGIPSLMCLNKSLGRFRSLSSICDKAIAYNCIGRVYCLHSVFGEFSVQAPPRDPPLEAKLAVLASSTRSYPKGNSKCSWACHDK